jgi:CDP-diacylglycerol--serine O-phosphatidyltransferase
LHHTGYFVAFLFMLCGAARLARFNIQKNPVPKNPGRPDRKYFVGLPIPAGASAVVAVIYAAGSEPIHNWVVSTLWLALLGLLSFLMVSTWRYPSFKDLSLTHPRSPLSIILMGVLIFLVWNFSQPVLLILAISYVGVGVAIRIGGAVRRRLRPQPQPPQEPEHQVG